MSEITRDEWDGIVAREQAKADRRWNRRRDLAVGAISTLGGGVLGAGIVAIVRVLA